MALAAVVLSIFAFIPPLGLAAVVLGHVAIRRIAASRGALEGKPTARAALIIGYLQIVLVTLATAVMWRPLRQTVQDFRHDAMVQRVLRETDPNQTLDPGSAGEQEATARALVIQLVAIEDQHHRGSPGGYLCSESELLNAGLAGSTPAEKEAFDARVRDSAYAFELRACDSTVSPPTGYRLAAVPKSPRMPPGSRIFCADQTGAIKQSSGGTSLECFERGSVIVEPAPPAAEESVVPSTHPSPAPEPELYCGPYMTTPCGPADMQVVRRAETSPDALWEFLTSPDTGPAERRVAASRAERTIPVDWLPKMIQARQQLEREQALHNFGLADYPFKDYSPFYLLKSPRDKIGAETTRMILGHAFVVPDKWIEFPATEEGMKRAWPAQVLSALGVLYEDIVRKADPREVDSAALRLPCSDYATAHEIVDLTLEVAETRHFAPPEVFGTWLNIQNGNPDLKRASVGILGSLGNAVTRPNNTWAMAQVLGLEALRTKDITITYPTIDAIGSIHPTPHTLALAAARYLAVSKDSPFWRAYGGDALFRALGEPLLGAPRYYDAAKQAEYERDVNRFADWLKKNEARLNEGAAAEKPLIEDARQKMSLATACRP